MGVTTFYIKSKEEPAFSISNGQFWGMPEGALTLAPSLGKYRWAIQKGRGTARPIRMENGTMAYRPLGE